MKLNEAATDWLDSWVNPKTNTNEHARVHAKAIAAHIAALQGLVQELEGENASLRGEDTHICDCCYGTGIGIGGQPCMACKGAADAKAAFDKHAKELDSPTSGEAKS
jgi:hypothetical protein